MYPYSSSYGGSRYRYQSSDTKKNRSKVLLDLWDVVSGLDAPGTFACGGQLSAIVPGLHINGFGDVGLPLRERDAKDIITLCQRAPFGRGEKTIVDTKVRNTWQLSPSEIKLNNKEFVQQINSIVKTVANELGLGKKANVEARLYKLLLYEPGGFFVPHKDTEKEKGMFASLVITLPSTFEGGELIVTHKGMTKKFRPENPSFSTSWVSFYADCKHEIKPVTSGYRLALVYNVVSLDSGPLPGPSSGDEASKVAECIQKWNDSSDGPAKAVFVLQHEYTPAGLSVQVLKNKDRAMAQVLQEAIKGQEFDMYLALLSYTKSGPAEESRHKQYSLAAISHEHFRLHSLVNMNGEKVELKVAINYSDVYPMDAFGDDKADHESIEEATGNEGASIELRYHRAVILLWPKSKWINIICQGDKNEAVRYMNGLIANCPKGSPEAPEWQTVKKVAQLLIPRMRIEVHFFNSLIHINDVKLVQNYLQHAASSERDITLYGNDNAQQFSVVLNKCVAKFGWEALVPSVTQFAQALSPHSCLEFLMEYCSTTIDNPKAKEMFTNITRHLITVKCAAMHSYNSFNFESLSKLAKVVFILDPQSLPSALKMVENLKDMDKETIPAVKKIYEMIPAIGSDNAFVKLVKHCVTAVEKRVEIARSATDDWVVRTPLKCNCNDCKPVRAFLLSPTEMEYRFKAGIGRRSHVEHESMGNGHRKSDSLFVGILKTTTDTSRSPNTLIITKVGKEIVVATKNAKKDENMIRSLNDMIGVKTAQPEKAPKKPQPTVVQQPVAQQSRPVPQIPQSLVSAPLTIPSVSTLVRPQTVISVATASDPSNVSAKRPREGENEAGPKPKRQKRDGSAAATKDWKQLVASGSLSTLRLDDLKDYIAWKGIKGKSSLNKVELIEVIKSHVNEQK